jgi:hypothetical protein
MEPIWLGAESLEVFRDGGGVMMGRRTVDQSQLFYLFNLERRIPQRHLLRRINSDHDPDIGRATHEAGAVL